MKTCGLTQAQLAEIYATTQQNIAQHIKNIYAEDELEAEATHKKFLLVRQEGARSVRREMDHYNLDVVIALGYRIQSQVGDALSPLGNGAPARIYPKRVCNG